MAAHDRIFVSLEYSRVHFDAQGPDGPTIFWKGRPDTTVTISAVEAASLDPETHPQLSSLAVKFVQRLSATGLFTLFSFPAAFPWKLTAPLQPREEPYDFSDLRTTLEQIYAEVMQREVTISQTSSAANRRWRRVTGALTLRTLRRRRRARHHTASSDPKAKERFREGMKDLVEDALDSAGDSGGSSRSSGSSHSTGGRSSSDGCDLGCDGCGDGCGGCD